ncbi:MAG: phosphoribulokinase [Proteobacteria bacterium]|nr:phosphoribulokinase [Pseudomonadota bacterium]
MQRTRPILLGIVGDSAAGKTTISAGIEKILGPERVTNLCSDDYHKYNRTQRAEKNISALHPDCNHIDIMQHNFYQLRRGEAILKPVYNHSTGDFDPPVYVEPKEFVIIEGLLGFSTKKMRDAFDVKIYLDPEEELRVDWKYKRDTIKRGYTREEVQASLERRTEISANFIRPQRKFADIVCNFHQAENENGETNGILNTNLILRPTIPHPDFAEFIDHRPGTKEKCLSLTLGRDEGLPVDILKITGTIKPVTAETLMDIIIDHLETARGLTTEGVGAYMAGDEEKISYPLGIMQLLTCFHLMNAKLDN